MQLRSGRREQDPAKDRPPTPTSLSQWREGLRCQKYDQSPISEDCECRWSRTCLQKAHCNASAATALDTRSVTAGTRPVASRVVAPTSPVVALPRENSLCAVAAGETTLRTTGAISSGKTRGRLLQSKHASIPERAPPQATLPPRKLSGPGPLPSRWNLARGGITSSEGGVLSRLPPPPLHPNPKTLSASGHGGARAAKSGRYQEDGHA
jgi:hypothetical protein